MQSSLSEDVVVLAVHASTRDLDSLSQLCFVPVPLGMFERAGISEQLWGLFPMLYSTWDKYAFDLIGNIAVPIDNYISRGTDVFVTGTAANGSR